MATSGGPKSFAEQVVGVGVPLGGLQQPRADLFPGRPLPPGRAWRWLRARSPVRRLLGKPSPQVVNRRSRPRCSVPPHRAVTHRNPQVHPSAGQHAHRLDHGIDLKADLPPGSNFHMIAHLATKHFQNVWLRPAGHLVTRSPQHRDQRLGGGDGLVGQGPAGFCQIDDVDRHPGRVGGVFGGEPGATSDTALPAPSDAWTCARIRVRGRAADVVAGSSVLP